MTPLGWAGRVRLGYALAWFLVTDRVKLLAYRVLDHIKAETKMEPRPPEARCKADASKPDAKADAKPEAKPTRRPARPRRMPRRIRSPMRRAILSRKPRPTPPSRTTRLSRARCKRDPKPNATADASEPDANVGDPKPDAKSDSQPEAIVEPALVPNPCPCLTRRSVRYFWPALPKIRECRASYRCGLAKSGAAPEAPETGAELTSNRSHTKRRSHGRRIQPQGCRMSRRIAETTKCLEGKR